MKILNDMIQNQTIPSSRKNDTNISNNSSPSEQQIKKKNYDSFESSSEKPNIDEELAYINSVKDMLAKQKENSALANIIRNTSTPKDNDEPSPQEVDRICKRIAARIRKGHKVPLKDIKYIKKYDPILYQLATMSAKPNKNPKKCKQLSPDEKPQNIDLSSVAPPAIGGEGVDISSSSETGSSASE